MIQSRQLRSVGLLRYNLTRSRQDCRKNVDTGPITKDEIIKALRRIKTGKAPGPDHVNCQGYPIPPPGAHNPVALWAEQPSRPPEF